MTEVQLSQLRKALKKYSAPKALEEDVKTLLHSLNHVPDDSTEARMVEELYKQMVEDKVQHA